MRTHVGRLCKRLITIGMRTDIGLAASMIVQVGFQMMLFGEGLWANRAVEGFDACNEENV